VATDPGDMSPGPSGSSSPAVQLSTAGDETQSSDDCVSVHSTRTVYTYLVDREEYGKVQGLSEETFQRSRL
jgi:hypothetical protein